VPFRTSPATPQPVAFSSGSTLPTSSPPHFSNGSIELQPCYKWLHTFRGIIMCFVLCSQGMSIAL
jgi:hypothetical protein